MAEVLEVLAKVEVLPPGVVDSVVEVLELLVEVEVLLPGVVPPGVVETGVAVALKIGVVV